MEKITNLFKYIILLVGRHTYGPLQNDKVFFILLGLVLCVIFVVFFSYLYYRAFWNNPKLRKLFFWCVGSTIVFVLAKYSLNYFKQTYLVERILFYALPSPRLQSIPAFVLAIATFLGFLKFRTKIEQLPNKYFIAVITATFILFTISVASMRIGIQGVGEPFSHHSIEYTGALQYANPLGLKNFLNRFSDLVPVLPMHPSSHPPGYVVVLYIIQSLFKVGDLGLAIGVVLITSCIIGPLYLFWQSVYGRAISRRMTQVFIFVPSVVMFTATSMDAFNMCIVWLAIIACYFGWKQSYALSFLAGLAVAYASFSNYLFVFMLPLFLSLVWFSVKEVEAKDKKFVFCRIVTTTFSFVLFFVALWLWARYSIITNLIAGHEHWQNLIIDYSVENNIGSLWIYLVFAFNNFVPFIWYLGAPTSANFVQNFRRAFFKSNWWFNAGMVILLLFLFTGIVLGGETERIFLFLVPLFLMFRTTFYEQAETKEFNAFLSLLFFQIMVFQIAFHTYW